MSGTFELFRKPTTLVWVGVPRPSKIPNTFSCSTSWWTTLTVFAGLYSSFLIDQVDLASVDAALGVQVVEERLRGGCDLAVARAPPGR